MSTNLGQNPTGTKLSELNTIGGRTARPDLSSSPPFCVRFSGRLRHLAPDTCAATLDTEPLARSYSDSHPLVFKPFPVRTSTGLLIANRQGPPIRPPRKTNGLPTNGGCQTRSKLALRRYHYSYSAKRYSYSRALASPYRHAEFFRVFSCPFVFFRVLPCPSVCIRGFRIPALVRLATESHRKARKQTPGSSCRSRGSARSTHSPTESVSREEFVTHLLEALISLTVRTRIASGGQLLVLRQTEHTS